MRARGSSALIADAERRFLVRIRLAVPAGSFGQRLEAMYAWLDQNCGTDGWRITPAGLRGVMNDAVAIYFRDAALAAGFVFRWCRQRLPEVAEGAFVVRDDDPVPPRPAPAYQTPQVRWQTVGFAPPDTGNLPVPDTLLTDLCTEAIKVLI